MEKGSILITGCSSGIGFHAAIFLQERGYQVFACVRQAADIERLKSLGVNVLLMDLNNTDSIDAAIDTLLVHTGGKLDFLFNNGAYGQPGAVEDIPTEVLRTQFETNVFGWHHLTRRVLKVMREQGHGRIVQNSSVLGFVCMPYRGAYNASKFAIEGLTDTMRLELTGSNIYVSLIEPGPIESRFRANALLAFKANIDWQNSIHHAKYVEEIRRLEKEGPSTTFTLGPEAVTKALLHAMESKVPKARYRVTTPTKIFSFLKRILSSKMLDRLLAKA
ncbi:SDR family oxidoreductase [Aliikangiella sp. G2MR2-5]|uniref:SDR family oxidoreductase n=1 Tax=Aliikangiella sp. G2MR2-5 TaxID=2788943 RepID=UPI0018A8A952|nr:SDR family oxidoreductase [Aliikangiella sp. G2MR2-5]